MVLLRLLGPRKDFRYIVLATVRDNQFETWIFFAVFKLVNIFQASIYIQFKFNLHENGALNVLNMIGSDNGKNRLVMVGRNGSVLPASARDRASLSITVITTYICTFNVSIYFTILYPVHADSLTGGDIDREISRVRSTLKRIIFYFLFLQGSACGAHPPTHIESHRAPGQLEPRIRLARRSMRIGHLL
jgi:hypothetical protein